MKTYAGFYDLHHMEQYLSRSLIRLGDEPIYVLSVYEGDDRAGNIVPKIKFKWLRSGKVGIVNLRSKRINLDPVPLGFINILRDARVIRAVRMPARMWKIGLSPNNILLSHVPYTVNNLFPLPGRENLVFSKPIRETILGHYPSYAEVLGRLRMLGHPEINPSIAFNRKFCLSLFEGREALFYFSFDNPVGYVGPGDILSLDPEFFFLNERLNEALNVPARY